MTNTNDPAKTIMVDDSPPGAGKTTTAIQRCIAIPGRYLWSTERLESIRETAALARRHADQSLPAPVIVEITSDVSRGSSVRTEIESLPDRFCDAGHVIAICSHAAMLMADFSEFAGWHVIVDETPDVLDVQELQSMIDYDFFERHYTLSPTGSADWFAVGLTEAGASLTGSQLHSDDSHRHLRTFHRRVTEAAQPSSQRAVICNLPAWSAMHEQDLKWVWGSLFTAAQLQPFSTRTLLGNRCMDSLAVKLLSAADPALHWQVSRSTGNRVWAQRDVKVVYFSERRGSRYFLDSPDGHASLRKIGQYLADTVDPQTLIWTANEFAASALESVMPGRRLRPRQAGSNAYASFHNAAIIYTAKPSPNISTLIGHLGVERSDWIRTNEFEIILQFITRTSIRDDTSIAPIRLFVFERSQAEYLVEYLDTLTHVNASCEFVDLSLPDQMLKRGRKPQVLTVDEVAAKQAAFRARKAKNARDRRARERAINSNAK